MAMTPLFDPSDDTVSFFAPAISEDSLRAVSWAKRWSDFWAQSPAFGASANPAHRRSIEAFSQEARRLPERELAQQYYFSLHVSSTRAWVDFSCALYFQEHGDCSDSLAPLSRLLPSPDLSDRHRGDDDEDQDQDQDQDQDHFEGPLDSSAPDDARALVLGLLSRGFRWNRSMQIHAESSGSAPGLGAMEALLTALALEAEELGSTLPSPSRRL